MRGRKPKPLSVHKTHGTYRRDRHAEEINMPKGAPSCPEHLTGEAAAEWERLRAALAPGMVCKADRAILAAFCACHGRLVEAELKVAELGAVITTTKGELKINPWLRVADESRKQLRGLAAELGLTPSSRGRVTPVHSGSEEEDAFFKLLDARVGVAKRVRA